MAQSPFPGRIAGWRRIPWILACLLACTVDLAAATGYACIRVVRSDPGFPSAPTISVPAGYSLVTSSGYAVASEAEYFVFIQGPSGTARGVTVSWPGIPISAVIWNDTRLSVRSVSAGRDRLICDVPVTANSLRNAWPTFEVHSFFDESNLNLRVEHNNQYRRAGWYAERPWVSGQARSVVNYLFAARLAMRDWGQHNRIAAAGAGRMALLGFESNVPLHIDHPPHLHIILYLPTSNNAGTKVSHYYMDDLGLIRSNKIQVLQRPDLGDQFQGVGQPMDHTDTSGRVWLTTTIRPDGGLSLGPNRSSVAYALVPGDASTGSTRSVLVLRGGTTWARVTTTDDTITGILTTRADFTDGRVAQTSTSYYDPLTGAPLSAPAPMRAAPTITSPDGAAATVGNAFRYAITATRNPTSFAASGLPAGLVVDTRTGIISGRPSTVGTYRVTIAAINALGRGTAPVTLAVTGSGTTSGSFSAKIDFQPAGSSPAAGYLVDSGATFAARNGLSYGWNAPCESRERNAVTDQRLDTLV
ncbi:MAG: putative Ig domain-containing protein, partial [Planctomycetes bacterium]|nr:putative Ig domain-containing protein [Planctomycetota bacterium]